MEEVEHSDRGRPSGGGPPGRQPDHRSQSASVRLPGPRPSLPPLATECIVAKQSSTDGMLQALRAEHVTVKETRNWRHHKRNHRTQ